MGGRLGGQRTATRQDLRQHAHAAHVHDYEDRARKILRQVRHEGTKRIDSAGRSPDYHNVARCHDDSPSTAVRGRADWSNGGLFSLARPDGEEYS